MLHEGDQRGWAACARGDMLAVGTPAEERDVGTNRGVVDSWVYRDGAWRYASSVHAPDAADYDAFGSVKHGAHPWTAALVTLLLPALRRRRSKQHAPRTTSS